MTEATPETWTILSLSSDASTAPERWAQSDGLTHAVAGRAPRVSAQVRAADRSYDNVSNWELDDDWRHVLARTVRVDEAHRDQVSEELNTIADLIDRSDPLSTERCVAYFGAAAAAGALTSRGPYCMLQPVHEPIAGAGLVGAAHAECVIYLDCSDPENPNAIHIAWATGETEELDGESISDVLNRRCRPLPRESFESLRQLRWELWYEADSVDVYDAKYHDAPCYVDLDTILADTLAENLPQRPTRRVLDLGCGPGSMIPFLRDIPGIEIVGIDIAPAMIREARRVHPDIEFQVGSSEVLPFDDRSFDGVLVSGMLHHLPNLYNTLAEIRRVLAPDGVLVCREPNCDNFAARYPQVAMVHQALRSLHLDVDRVVPVYEPDSHDDHIDFTPDVLAANVAQVLRVCSVESHGCVSYFYDNVGKDGYSYVRSLEATLAGHSGLNLVVVARPGSSGVDPQAMVQLVEAEIRRPIGLDHLNALTDELERLVEMRREMPEYCQSLSIEDRLAHLPEPTFGDEVAGHPQPVPSHHVVDTSLSPSEFGRAIASVSDHGWLRVIGHSGSTDGLPALGRALSCVGLEHGRAGFTLLARPNVISPIDAAHMMQAALDSVSHDHVGVGSETLDAIARRVSRLINQELLSGEPSSFDDRLSLASVLATLVES